MYKSLPEGVETEEQRLARERKAARDANKSLVETNLYITPESLKFAVETSSEIEGIDVDLDDEDEVEAEEAASTPIKILRKVIKKKIKKGRR